MSACSYWQPCLGGNTVTVLIATVSPSVVAFEESVATLHLASRAKSIKNDAKRNEDASDKIVAEIRAEIDSLREQLTRMPKPKDGQPPEKITTLEESISALQRAKMSAWDERERVSKLVEKDRAAVMDDHERQRRRHREAAGFSGDEAGSEAPLPGDEGETRCIQGIAGHCDGTVPRTVH
jgi:hypothetical protein